MTPLSSKARSLPHAGEPAPDANARGPAWLALGFRPFFLLAGAFATVAVPLWLLVFFGRVTLPLRVYPAAWHAHEMLFGFVVAVIAGFLLTAVRNWTSRPTPSGSLLGALAGLWLLGRVAMSIAGLLPAPVAPIVDLAFVPALALAIGVPIVRAKNWRNLAFIPLLLMLFGANLAFHLNSSTRLLRFALDVIVVIVLVVGGRVIPMFTGNAIKMEVRKRPWLDWASVVAMAPVALFDLVPGGERGYAFAAIAAGVLAFARMTTWRTSKTRTLPIVWVLHVSWAWIALGLVLQGAAVFVPQWPSTAPMHAVAVGAVSTMILGMMTRVSLGHTGRMLVVPRSITFGYVVLTFAALARALGPLVLPRLYVTWLVSSGIAWGIAFAIFTVVYLPILGTPRVDGKPG